MLHISCKQMDTTYTHNYIILTLQNIQFKNAVTVSSLNQLLK
jgi:hypothetical protein